MKQLQQLTIKQKEKMLSVKKFWLDRIFSCKQSIDREGANKFIEWMYSLSKIKKPLIIHVESPLACQYAVHYLRSMAKVIPLLKQYSVAQVRDQVSDQVSDQVWAQVRDQVWAQVRDQVWAQVWAQVSDQVRDQVSDQVRDQVWAQVRDQVWAQVRAQVSDQVSDQVWAQVRDQVWAQVRDQVSDQKIEYSSFSHFGNIADFAWVSFYDFFTQIGIINHEKFNQFKCFLQCGVYEMIQLQGFCITSNMPSKICRNETGRLHNPTGPAIEFRDGFKLYFINGRSIPSEVFTQASTLTKKQFLKERNSDFKGAWYEILGQKKMMDLLGAREIDTQNIVHANGDIETITLLKTKEQFEEIGNQPFAWVKMICPSTGTQYLQGVEPHHNDALSAIASLSPFKKEEYSFNYRS
jgi:hypothetical protein